MHWEKKICIRITFRRIVGAILAASTVANLIIVGAVFGAESAPAAPTLTSALLTPLWTATLSLPTSTAEEIVTSAPTLIVDAAPTETFPPTETFTPTQTPVDPPIWIVCVKRFYWPTYRVQAGDTLFSIASRAGSSVDGLRQANCRANDRIYSGELLYVPRLWNDPNTVTPTASATSTPTGTPTPTYTPTTAHTDTPTATPSPRPTDTPTPTYTPTDPPPPPPDLVVAVLQVSGPAEILPVEETIVIPIYILIQNQGGSDAEIFKVSAHYAGRAGKFVAPFIVSDQSDNGYLYSTARLAAGHEMAFTGMVALPITLQGQTIALSVLADSCSGDQSMPADCRVAEGNENNNESQPWTVRLPSNYSPSVAITVPDADKSYVYGDKILLQGSATDPEDGVLSGSALVWSSDGTQLGTGTEVDVTTYINDACGTSFMFTLTAIDHDRNVATARRKIDLICPLN